MNTNFMSVFGNDEIDVTSIVRENDRTIVVGFKEGNNTADLKFVQHNEGLSVSIGDLDIKHYELLDDEGKVPMEAYYSRTVAPFRGKRFLVDPRFGGLVVPFYNKEELKPYTLYDRYEDGYRFSYGNLEIMVTYNFEKRRLDVGIFKQRKPISKEVLN